MRFHYRDLDDCHTATGTVIVIDVLRAFSTAAYAFSLGAREILLVGTVEDALSLRQQIPNSKVMGEVNGIRPDGFDFGNSPTYLSQEDLSGLTMIQRTTAGTQGVIRSKNAEVLLASSLVVANTTIQHVKKLGSDQVTFVITGKDFGGGDEDLACAEYLEALLKEERPNPQPFIQRVLASRDASQHFDPTKVGFPITDLDYCTQVDRFDFAMPIERNSGRLIMRCVNPCEGC
jgi:2-phosphosulfolactate phosphatase